MVHRRMYSAHPRQFVALGCRTDAWNVLVRCPVRRLARHVSPGYWPLHRPNRNQPRLETLLIAKRNEGIGLGCAPRGQETRR